MGIGSWIKGAAGTVTGTVSDGWNQLTTGADDPSARRNELQKPYKPKQEAFDITGREDAQAQAATAADAVGQGMHQAQGAEANLAGGFNAPQMSRPAYDVQTAKGNATTTGSTGGMSTAYRALDAGGDSRQAQQDALGLVNQTAMGQGPSVAPGMMQENAAAAAADISQAGTAANQQFNAAATQAGLGYGDAASAAQFAYQEALAQQQAAGMQAGTAAARQTMQSAEDAIRQQAALTAGARGSNIGSALLNAQGNAAQQMAQSGRQANQIMADTTLAAGQQGAAAQRAASMSAADQQRQAAAIQAGVNQQTGANLANASTAALEQRALGDARAAQLMSQEQLAAQGMALDATGQMRAGDTANVQSAIGIGQLGLGQDQLATQTAMQNAQMTNDMGQFNATNTWNYDSQQAQLDAANNALNAQVYAGAAERGQDLFNTGFGAQQGMTMADAQAAMELERLRSANANAGMERGQQFDENATANRGNIIGGIIGAGSSIGAAMLSDEREKDIEGDEEDHDFTKTKSKKYRYKDPKVSGADDREHIGPMAQELPKSAIIEGDDGKLRVDVGRLALSLASAMGDVQRKLGKKAA
jgi:hypothetical protein